MFDLGHSISCSEGATFDLSSFPKRLSDINSLMTRMQHTDLFSCFWLFHMRHSKQLLAAAVFVQFIGV